MRLREILISEDDGGASVATTSADIATVAYPLLVRGKNKKEKRKNARAAVGQSYNAGPVGIGQGVYEDELSEASLATMRDFFAGNNQAKDTTKLAVMRDYFSKNRGPVTPDIQRILDKVKAQRPISTHEYSMLKAWADNRRKFEGVDEAHTLNSDNVIYRLDKDKPMSDTEVLVLGGAGRYTLAGLRDKARREAQELANDLQVEHGGSFRRAAHNIKQLTNTLNTIVAAYNELARIRRKGGRGSRGITDEDANFIRECMNTLQNYTNRVSRAQRLAEGLKMALKEGKKIHLQPNELNPAHVNAISGMFHLNTDPGYGFYRWAIHVAGNHGGNHTKLGTNAGPFAFAYTDEEEKMIHDAVHAITGRRAIQITPRGSKEADDVHKISTTHVVDWNKVK